MVVGLEVGEGERVERGTHEEEVEMDMGLGPNPESAGSIIVDNSGHNHNSDVDGKKNDDYYSLLETRESRIESNKVDNFPVIIGLSPPSSSSCPYVYGPTLASLSVEEISTHNEGKRSFTTDYNDPESSNVISTNNSIEINIGKIDLIDKFDDYIKDYNLVSRLDRLERLVRERRDIVDSYNQQQRDEKPIQDMIKDFTWILIKSRPLLRLTCDHDDMNKTGQNSIMYDENGNEIALPENWREREARRYCLVNRRTRNVGIGLIKLTVRGFRQVLKLFAKSVEFIVNFLLNGR